MFSSIDSGGRYRFRNQAPIALWNLSRFAESLLPLIDPSPDRAVDLATEVLDRFQDDYEQARLTAFRAKLGLTDAARPGDAELIESLLGELATNGADYTLAWRHLADALTSGEPIAEVSEGWMAAWRARVPGEPAAVAEAMNQTNPLYVPRNHLVEAALEEAAEGERAAYDRLVAAVRSPYAAVPGQEDLGICRRDRHRGEGLGADAVGHRNRIGGSNPEMNRDRVADGLVHLEHGAGEGGGVHEALADLHDQAVAHDDGRGAARYRASRVRAAGIGPGRSPQRRIDR